MHASRHSPGTDSTSRRLGRYVSPTPRFQADSTQLQPPWTPLPGVRGAPRVSPVLLGSIRRVGGVVAELARSTSIPYYVLIVLVVLGICVGTLLESIKIAYDLTIFWKSFSFPSY